MGMLRIFDVQQFCDMQIYNSANEGPMIYGFGFMVFNATFNNILAISWRIVLFVEETGVPGEKQRKL